MSISFSAATRRGYPAVSDPNRRGRQDAMPEAIVIGAGPNGLVAANVLADAGLAVPVYEAEPVVGGAVRTEELVQPGFRNDVFSAFYPLAVSSPSLRAMELERWG